MVLINFFQFIVSDRIVGFKILIVEFFVLFTAKPGGQVKCQYISAVDKVIFVDDYAVGCRKDLNGILLLDTALQTPVSKQDDVVQLELPVTEVSRNKLGVCHARGNL